MVSDSVICGKADAGEIVITLRPGTLKLIVCAPGLELACSMAARRVQCPVPSSQTISPRLLSGRSPFESTTKLLVDNTCTTLHAENSEVLLPGSVAVAVTTVPAVSETGRLTLIGAFPPPSVITFVKPMNVCPSPLPEASQAG